MISPQRDGCWVWEVGYVGHSDDPRDSCGGTRRCGSNLLVASAAPSKPAKRRKLQNVREMISGVRAAWSVNLKNR
jgi:hypothetical protein